MLSGPLPVVENDAAHGNQYVFRQITLVAEHELIAQQQLAEFKEKLKFHHNAILLPSIHGRIKAALIYTEQIINHDTKASHGISNPRSCSDDRFHQADPRTPG